MRKAFLSILCLFIYLHCCTWHGYFKQTFYPDNTLFSFTSYAKEGNFEVEMVSLKTSSLWTKINKDILFKKRQLITSSSSSKGLQTSKVQYRSWSAVVLAERISVFFISNQYCYTTSQTESSRLARSPRNIYFLARLSTYDKSCGFLQKLKAYKSIKM